MSFPCVFYLVRILVCAVRLAQKNLCLNHQRGFGCISFSWRNHDYLCSVWFHNFFWWRWWENQCSCCASSLISQFLLRTTCQSSKESLQPLIRLQICRSISSLLPSSESLVDHLSPFVFVDYLLINFFPVSFLGITGRSFVTFCFRGLLLLITFFPLGITGGLLAIVFSKQTMATVDDE